MELTQVVQVQILGSRRAYTYEWAFQPALGEAPLQVGDKVEIPPNMVQEEGSSATVSALGSDYHGPMKRIIRKIERPGGRPRIGEYRVTHTSPDEVTLERWPDEDDKWAGFGQGDYE